MGFISMAMKDSYEPPYTLGKILKEALKLLTKSLKLTLPIIIFTFIYSISTFIANTNYTTPLIQDFSSKLLLILNNIDPNVPLGPNFFKNLISMGKDLKQYTIIQAVIFFTSFIFSFILTISATYTFTTAYSGEPLSAKGLLKVFKKRWYQTLITQLYILIFNIGFEVLLFSVIGVALLMTKSSSLCMGITFIALSLYIYIITRWQVSLVVTVNEKSYGIGAFSKAVILFKGNEKKGCAVTILVFLVAMAMTGAFMFIIRFMKVESLMMINVGFLALMSLFSTYVWAVYTVYYFECRKSHGIVDEEGDQYVFMFDSLLPRTTKV
ncbi:uncharacterized protein LOC120267171 [Dioscorea cayenensis subsp. rotundata]|uniref:Uncharacterized protein LOC120267171 n=1 Tax=Dioscorea cayennensis subsp. rotundata TaxID=55577 RepID=A0AB40BTP2_DIOCR|nr:uncharacterized protein LOC120267171 [Dioscorea cayenensis subsp. rotundata]